MRRSSLEDALCDLMDHSPRVGPLTLDSDRIKLDVHNDAAVRVVSVDREPHTLMPNPYKPIVRDEDRRHFLIIEVLPGSNPQLFSLIDRFPPAPAVPERIDP